MSKRKSFLMYLDWHKNIKKMSQEEKGLLVDLMYASYMDETLPEIPKEFMVLDIMWDGIEPHLDRTKSNYERVSNKDTDSNETKERESTESLKTVDREYTEKKRPKAKAKAKVNAKEKANAKKKVKDMEDKLIKEGIYNPTNKIPSAFKDKEEYITTMYYQ